MQAGGKKTKALIDMVNSMYRKINFQPESKQFWVIRRQNFVQLFAGLVFLFLKI